MNRRTQTPPEEWSEQSFNEHDNQFDEDESTPANLVKWDNPLPTDDGHDELHEEEDEESPGGKAKSRRSKKRKLRVTEEVASQMVRKGREHRLILHALYVHRRLTIGQLCSLYFREERLHKISSIVRRLHAYGLLERRRIFAVAQTLAEARTYHYALTPSGIRVYAAACMNVAWLHEDPNLPKQHFSHGDLQIGSQADHHFILQEFLCEILGTLWKEKVYIPNSEWRRFLFIDSAEEVHYRPDWILFKPNAFFNQLAEEGRVGEDILSVPVLTRNQVDQKVIRDHYRAAISVECDTGTMRHGTLVQKWHRIRNEKNHIPSCVAVLTGEGKLGEERVKNKWSDNKVRVRNIGLTVRDVLESELLTDEMVFLIGKQSTLSYASAAYLHMEGDLTKSFAEVEATIRTVHPQSKMLTLKDWDARKVQVGMPNTSFRVQDRTYACFFARPGWINPHVKVNAILEKTGPEVRGVLIYHTKSHFALDAHLFQSERIRYVVFDEWVAGDRSFYVRVLDRNGELWEVREE